MLMTFEEFQTFINEQDRLLKSVTNREGNDVQEIFARTIKLGEEFGELCDEVLASVGNQRKDKLSEPRELEGEFADVVIVAFLLAKVMNVDMQKAIPAKIEKIRAKHNKQLNHYS